MPRKTDALEADGRRILVASMRPRPDAAENARADLLVAAAHRASMRPRPDAAENVRKPQVAGAGQHASMRPRPDAAENSRPRRRTA